MSLPLSDAKRRRILALLERGAQYRDIARTLHCGISSVYKVNLSRGIKPRYGSKPRPMPSTVPEHAEGAPYCPRCEQAFWYSTDLQYGATLESCRCGTKILSRGFAA